jgi:small GTP-binding protein
MMGENKLKIVVFGSYNAGKSTFVQSIDPKSRHIEAETATGSTTVAFDFGRVMVGDTKVYLFGTPGQEHFEFVRRILARGMDGAVIVVDSTVEIDDMTYYLCEWLSEQAVPFVIMINKCDSPGSRPDLFQSIIGDGFAHCISALTGENVYASLEAFVNRISILSPQNE